MTTAVDLLMVGFDSAWTRGKRGAIVAAVRLASGGYQELGLPVLASYAEALDQVQEWKSRHQPDAALVMLDQPTIVRNVAGQRPVEHLVSSAVSRRYGGVQPANTARSDMFGPGAPVWEFLAAFGGAADPFAPLAAVSVFETYPVLAMIAQDWLRPDLAGGRPTGCLPKYNPQRRKTFSLADWQYVCGEVVLGFTRYGLRGLADWAGEAGACPVPRKADQDRLDACICLLTALHVADGGECLMVGDLESGYIVVPFGAQLHREMLDRCDATGRPSSHWVKHFRV